MLYYNYYMIYYHMIKYSIINCASAAAVSARPPHGSCCCQGSATALGPGGSLAHRTQDRGFVFAV